MLIILVSPGGAMSSCSVIRDTGIRKLLQFQHCYQVVKIDDV